MTTRLIVLDIDGVLSSGEAQPFDTALLSRLGDLNRRARQNSGLPAVTLNTGRPSSYVEAVMQAIDGWQPALYESGAGMYFPDSYHFETTPLLTEAQRARLERLVQVVDRAVVRRGHAYWQPGKTVCYTLFAQPDHTVQDVGNEISAIIGADFPGFRVTQAAAALNIQPAHIDKGTGLRWLAEVTGIALQEMAGVGDTAGDVDFLRLAGTSAAPANASPEVRANVQYVSDREAVAGLDDILNAWGL